MFAVEPDFGTVLEISGAPVAVVDDQWRAAFVSKAFTARTGLKARGRIAIALDRQARAPASSAPALTDRPKRRGGERPAHAEQHYVTWSQRGTKHACRVNRLPDGTMVLTLLGAAPGPTEKSDGLRLVEALWELTPAEADIAWRHCHGESLSAICKARNVSFETVRTQMRTIRQKAQARNGRELQTRFWAALASSAEASAA